MQKLFARLRSLLGIVLSAPAHEHTKTLAWFSQKAPLNFLDIEMLESKVRPVFFIFVIAFFSLSEVKAVNLIPFIEGLLLLNQNRQKKEILKTPGNENGIDDEWLLRSAEQKFQSMFRSIGIFQGCDLFFE